MLSKIWVWPIIPILKMSKQLWWGKIHVPLWIVSSTKPIEQPWDSQNVSYVYTSMLEKYTQYTTHMHSVLKVYIKEHIHVNSDYLVCWSSCYQPIIKVYIMENTQSMFISDVGLFSTGSTCLKAPHTCPPPRRHAGGCELSKAPVQSNEVRVPRRPAIQGLPWKSQFGGCWIHSFMLVKA